MIFSSAVFLFLFLPIVFIGNLLIGKKYSNYFLLLASLIFYAWGSPYLWPPLIISILLNWAIGLAVSKSQGMKRKAFLVLGIVCDLGMLGYYKYAGFFAGIINSLMGKELLPAPETMIPLGISFFTFKAISYLADVYRCEVDASGNPVNVALYISFFPQLISGPLVRYRDVNEQIDKRAVSWIDVSNGFKRFIYGLGKKVLIANELGMCADAIFAYDITALDCKTAWIGALAYTFQIYYDFSGYSDMAIGLGKMFGFGTSENFLYPYMSHSITEFWRRWHMTLGAWFRDYVYIPLGGNEKGTLRTCINLMIVFLLSGLWHGADMSFVIWGLLHGAFAVIERVGLKKILDRSKVLSLIYTFFVATIGWVMFRADDTVMGLRYIAAMLMPWLHKGTAASGGYYMYYKTIFFFICAFLGMGVLKTLLPEKIKTAWKGSVVEAIYCVCILLVSMAAIASDTYHPFIYYQF